MKTLSDNDWLRYNRQIILKHFDADKQERLKNARVMVLGVGGLGCAAAQYLASSGIGEFTLIDFDTVSLSNLARQILFTDEDIGQPKVLVAKKQLQKINPNAQITTFENILNENELAKLIQQHDVIVDCSDNLPTRNQLNALCFRYKVPLVSGAAIRMEGLISVFRYHHNEPCYQCLSHFFGQAELTCAESGVMAPLVGIIGSLQAMETIKLITHFGENLIGRVILIDAMTMEFRTLKLAKQKNCEVCRNSN